MMRAFLLPLALGAVLVASHAQAQTTAWTLVGADDSGALAYSDMGDGTYSFLTRLAKPTDFGDAQQASGFTVLLKPDCAAMNEDILAMSFYKADKSVINAPPIGGNKPIATDGASGPDDVMAAKCQNKAVPKGETFAGQIGPAQDWLDGLIAKAKH